MTEKDTPSVAGTDVPATGAPVRPAERSFAIGLAWTAALVVAVMAVIARYFWLYDKSILWRFDGLGQHYPAIYAYNEWLRGVIASPQAGVPLWSWNMGLGADIIGTLAFPVIGDPFALVSLLVPMAWLEYAMAAMLALRVVASGIAAAVYFRKMGARNLPAALGVVLYVFATFLFIQGRHPYFMNAMVFLPLLLLGVEYALRDRKLWPLGIFVFLTALANFYFFYILTIITVMYAVARYFELTDREDRWRLLLPTAVRVGGVYAIGAALAAPLLLPALFAVLGTARSAQEFGVGLLYPAWVYSSEVAAMASGLFGSNSTFLGFGYLAWLLAPVLFLRRGKNSALKFMIVAFGVFVAVPWFGSMFNGFTYPSNRFAFAWGLFLALSAALVLSEDEPLSRRDVLVAIGFFALYVVPMWITVRPVPLVVAAPMVVGAVTCCVLAGEAYLAQRASRAGAGSSSPPRRLPLVLWTLLGLVVVNVVLNATFVHDRRFGNRLGSFETMGKVQSRFDKNLGSAVSELPKDGFYRTENSDTIAYNSSMVQGFPSTSFYFSTMSGALTEFRSELDSRPGWSSFSYDGFDDRVMPTTLLATKYYLAKRGAAARSRVPYGFRLERTVPRGAVYINEHALPLGFVYEQAINRSDYLKLGPVDRQAAMLQGAVIDDEAAPGVRRVAPAPQAVELPFSVLSEKGAHFDRQAGRIERTREDASIVVSVAPVTDAELYVEIRNFDNVVHSAEPTGSAGSGGIGSIGTRMLRNALQPDVLDTVFRAGAVRKTEEWSSPQSAYYWGNRSQTVNLGYQRGDVTTIAIQPRETGTLSFESLKVLALPMKDYPAMVSVLKANAMRDIEVGTNRVSGRVQARRDALLFLSIPYSSGWSATLDGEPVDIVRANTGFTGVPVPAGDHAVELTYVTPGLRAGLLLAGVTLLGLAAYAIAVWRLRRTSA